MKLREITTLLLFVLTSSLVFSQSSRDTVILTNKKDKWVKKLKNT
jgi:hypothetical protein